MSRRHERPRGKGNKPASYTRQVDILANAIVNDNPKVMGIDQLAPEIQATIVAGRLMGFHPVSVRWATGEFALMFCEPGCTMPRPEKILKAYYQCNLVNKTFPEGTCS